MGKLAYRRCLDRLFNPTTLFCGEVKLRHTLGHAHLILASSADNETMVPDVGVLREEHANPDVMRESRWLHFWISFLVCHLFSILCCLKHVTSTITRSPSKKLDPSEQCRVIHAVFLIKCWVSRSKMVQSLRDRRE